MAANDAEPDAESAVPSSGCFGSDSGGNVVLSEQRKEIVQSEVQAKGVNSSWLHVTLGCLCSEPYRRCLAVDERILESRNAYFREQLPHPRYRLQSAIISTACKHYDCLATFISVQNCILVRFHFNRIRWFCVVEAKYGWGMGLCAIPRLFRGPSSLRDTYPSVRVFFFFF